MFVSKRFTRFAGFWAFLVVVVVSYAGVFAVMGQPLLTWSNAAFVGLGVVYLGVAVAFGMPGAKSAESLAGRLIYFAIQMPLVTLIVFASPVQGGIALLVLPLVSQAVFMFPTVLVGLFSALLYAVTLAQIAAVEERLPRQPGIAGGVRVHDCVQLCGPAGGGGAGQGPGALGAAGGGQPEAS